MASPPSALDRKGVRRMLMMFGVLGVVGVLMMAISVAAGLIILVAAEAFFAIAYRRFSNKSDAQGPS